MNHLINDVGLPDPFAGEFQSQPTRKSASFRLGEKLGSVFLNLKGKVNRKYQAVTEGIHHQVEAEAEMARLAQEHWLQEQVDEISAEYQLKLKRLRIRYTWISLISLVIGCLVGVMLMVYF